MILSVYAIFILCRYNSIKNDTNNPEMTKRMKFVPFAFILVILYSFMPCFAALIMFIDSPADGIGALFVFAFSLGFTVLWIQGFFVVS